MRVYLRKGIKPRVLNGHPWVYDNEIEREIGEKSADGDIVDVYYGSSRIGKGYYNSKSKIRVRIMTRCDENVDEKLIEKKITAAANMRAALFDRNASYRVVFGEADGIPGLIIDKFAEYVSIQVNTLGIYKFKQTVIETLIKLYNPKGIFEKDDDKSAQKEGFDYCEGWIYGTGPELIEFEMNGIKFLADTKGQKTGFFLDQRINGLNTVKFAKDKRVIDAFTYTGNFGMHAMIGGASKVTFMDYSQRALDVLAEVLKRNSIDRSRYELINGNSFDILRKFDDEGRKFDLTIIDPPSMAKSRDAKENALRGYKELNLRAMKITEEGGYLSTSSCTQIVYDEDFKRVIADAAEDTEKVLKMVFKGTQPPDHPYLLNILETEYLKHYFMQVVSLKKF